MDVLEFREAYQLRPNLPALILVCIGMLKIISYRRPPLRAVLHLFILLSSVGTAPAMYMAAPLGVVLARTDVALTGTITKIEHLQYTVRVGEVLFGQLPVDAELLLDQGNQRLGTPPYEIGEKLLLCLERGKVAARGRSLTSSTLSAIGYGGEGELRIDGQRIRNLNMPINAFVDALRDRDSIRKATIRAVFARSPRSSADFDMPTWKDDPELLETNRRSPAHRAIAEAVVMEIKKAYFHVDKKLPIPNNAGYIGPDIRKAIALAVGEPAAKAEPPPVFGVNQELPVQVSRAPEGTLLTFPWYTYQIAFSPDSTLVAISAETKYLDAQRVGQKVITIRQWPNLTEVKRIVDVPAVWFLGFTSDSRFLCGENGAGLAILRTSDWTSRTLTLPAKVTCGTPAGGGRVVVGCEDGTVALCDLERGTILHLEKHHESRVTAMTAAAARSELFSGGQDGLIFSMDIHTLLSSRKFRPASGEFEVRDLCLTPGGEELVAILGDDSARVLHARSGDELRRLQGLMLPTHAAASGGVPHLVGIGSGTGGVYLSDLRTGQLVAGAPGDKGLTKGWHHRDSVSSIAFSPDGKRVATASADHTVHLLPVPPGM